MVNPILVVIVIYLTTAPIFTMNSNGLSTTATRILFIKFNVSMDNKIITIYILQVIQILFHVFMYLWRWYDIILVFLLMLTIMVNQIHLLTVTILFSEFMIFNIIINGQVVTIFILILVFVLMVIIISNSIFPQLWLKPLIVVTLESILIIIVNEIRVFDISTSKRVDSETTSYEGCLRLLRWHLQVQSY